MFYPKTAWTVGNTKERKTLSICAGDSRLRRSKHHVKTEKKAALRYGMNRSTGTSESAFLNGTRANNFAEANFAGALGLINGKGSAPHTKAKHH